MSKILTSILILGITIFTSIGDSFLKKSSNLPDTFHSKYLWIGTIIYALTSLMWVYVYRNMKFATSVTIYSIFSIIIFTFIGIFVFKESISIIEIIGILFAVISLIILTRFG